jgi:hypothetical protein
MLTLPGRAVVVGLLLVAFVSPAVGDEVSLPPTLVTEGALPATELEAVFQASKSETERTYELAPSFQWSPIPSFGLKLVVPLVGRDPRGSERKDAVEIKDYGKFNAGDRRPREVLEKPVGSRGDLEAHGVWDCGRWTLEIKRARDTGDKENDGQFSCHDGDCRRL